MVRSLGASTTTPIDDAFYFPADDSRHARTWLPWPHADKEQQKVIAALAQMITEFEPVALMTAPDDEAAARLACGPKVEIVPLTYSSLRLRDTGPTFLVDGKGGAAAVDWRFNGWGGRGDTADAALAHTLLGLAEVRRFRAPLTLEGSAFVCDGAGTLIALAAAVFDAARNPDVTRLEAFAIFQHWLGIARVIWIEDPHPADDLCTDVRALVAFAAPGRVLINAGCPTVRPSLARVHDALGKKLEIVELPAPDVSDAGAWSYTQYLAVNGAIIVPAFGTPTDKAAIDILRTVFPDRAIREIDARPLAAGGVSLASLAVPHPARLLERDRATVLPRSAWAQPAPDIDGLLQKYIDLAAED